MRYISTPEQAIKHLLGNAKTGRDHAAIKVLVDHINMGEHKDKESHWLFGKLFLYIFDKNLIHYKSSQGAIDSIRMALEQPMETYFKLIADVYDNKVTELEVRLTLSKHINAFLNDKKNYD